MTNKKTLPSTMSYEELLAAMEQEESLSPEESTSSTEEILEYENNVVPFLSHFNILPGETPVSKKLLYHLYKKSVDEPRDTLSFNRIVGQFLGHYRNYSGNFYMINQDQFAISSHIFKLFTQSHITKTKSNTYQKHFLTFCDIKNVTKGTHWVQGFVLYEIYRDFCRDRHKRAAFSYETFFTFLKENFKYKRVNKNRSMWFAVNEEAKNYYTKEQLDDIVEKRRSKKKG